MRLRRKKSKDNNVRKIIREELELADEKKVAKDKHEAELSRKRKLLAGIPRYLQRQLINYTRRKINETTKR